MASNNLEAIIYQHVVYGAGTILTGKSDIRSAVIQPDELEAAIAYAKPLLEGPDPDQQAAEPNGPSEYDLPQATSDLQQVLRLYNATVIDGRFIDDLATNPKSVAERLDIELSDSAAAAIEQARSTVVQHFGGTLAFGKKIVVIVIVAGIAIRAERRPYEIVVDSSGVIKV